MLKEDQISPETASVLNGSIKKGSHPGHMASASNQARNSQYATIATFPPRNGAKSELDSGDGLSDLSGGVGGDKTNSGSGKADDEKELDNLKSDRDASKATVDQNLSNIQDLYNTDLTNVEKGKQDEAIMEASDKLTKIGEDTISHLKARNAKIIEIAKQNGVDLNLDEIDKEEEVAVEKPAVTGVDAVDGAGGAVGGAGGAVGGGEGGAGGAVGGTLSQEELNAQSEKVTNSYKKIFEGREAKDKDGQPIMPMDDETIKKRADLIIDAKSKQDAKEVGSTSVKSFADGA